MSGPKPEETQGVPWADHNPTETSPPDHRREEYGEEDPALDADDRPGAQPETDRNSTPDDRTP